MVTVRVDRPSRSTHRRRSWLSQLDRCSLIAGLILASVAKKPRKSCATLRCMPFLFFTHRISGKCPGDAALSSLTCRPWDASLWTPGGATATTLGCVCGSASAGAWFEGSAVLLVQRTGCYVGSTKRPCQMHRANIRRRQHTRVSR